MNGAPEGRHFLCFRSSVIVRSVRERWISVPDRAAKPCPEGHFTNSSRILAAIQGCNITRKSLAPLGLLVCSLLRPGAVHDVATQSGGRSFRILRSEEHTYELQSLMRISYAVICL